MTSNTLQPAALLVAPHLTPGGHQELLSAACGKSKREVERLVAERFPRPDVKTSVCKPPERSVVRNNGAGAGAELGEQRRRFAVRPSSARESKRVRVERRASTPRPSSASATPPRAEQAPGRVRPSSSSPSLGAEQDPGRLIPATGRTNPSRYIPAHVLRAVWERDQGRCTYVDPVTGRRCDERRFVEIDHAEPHAFGGPATVDNLRMTCRTHNQYAARLLFGERSVEAAVRRARARGAKGAR